MEAQEFSDEVSRWFGELTKHHMEPNEACALALKISAGMTEPPTTVAAVMAALGAATKHTNTAVANILNQHEAEKAVYRLFSSPDSLHAAFWCSAPGQDNDTVSQETGGDSSTDVEMQDVTETSNNVGSNTDSSGKSAHIVLLPPSTSLDAKQQGIDLDAILDLYEAVKTAGSTCVKSLISASEKLLMVIAALPAAANPGLVRQLFILMLNPLLDELEHGKQLTSLWSALVSLSEEQRTSLIKLLACLPAEQLRKLVIMMQSYITITLYQKQAITSGVEAATQVLGMLNDANDMVAIQASSAHQPHRPEGQQQQQSECSGSMSLQSQSGPRQPLPYTEFYNDAVNNEDFNLKEDFRRWKSVYRTEFSFCRHPYVYDPASKARVLQMECQLSQYSELHSALFRGLFGGSDGELCPFFVLKVRRGAHLVQDTLIQVHHAKEQGTLRKPLKVKFVGEEGVDEGGVQKEFFTLLLRELFNPEYGMFVYDEEARLHWFRPSHLEMDTEFELVGILFGLAIYNSHILECSFPLVLYKLLVGVQPSFNDLKEPHPEIHGSLQKLLSMSAADVDACGLTFSVDVEYAFSQIESVELIPDGSNVPVTSSNRLQYVELYTQHLLQRCVERQLAAFRKGFMRMCASDALKWFRPEELELLVCGGRSLDLSALQAATVYDDGYSNDSTEVAWFWDVALSLSAEQQKRLLAFVTGSDRVPIKGLGALNPPFVISRMGGDADRLPTAHTCFNHLLLPAYTSKEMLRQRLIMALENAEGFGLM